MVLQNVREDQLVAGQKKALHDAGRQVCEGVVTGCKDREGACALQRGDQARRIYSGDQRLKATVTDGRLDEIAQVGEQRSVDHVNDAVAGKEVGVLNERWSIQTP